MKKSVIAILKNEAQADKVVDRLLSEGFFNENISILMSQKKGSSLSQIRAEDSSKQQYRGSTLSPEKHTKAPEGATTGAIAGGIIGGTLGLLAGIGSLAIPGLGAFVAAGPIMAALGGSAVGGSVGLITGALVGMGFTEIEAKQYESKLKKGNVLISVHAETSQEIDKAKRIFEKEGAEDISVITEKQQARNY